MLGTCCLSREAGLGGFGDQPGAETSGTDLHSNGPSLPEGFYLVEVGIPNFSRFVMGMANIMTKYRPLPADVTNFCHDRTSYLDFNQVNPI